MKNANGHGRIFILYEVNDSFVQWLVSMKSHNLNNELKLKFNNNHHLTFCNFEFEVFKFWNEFFIAVQQSARSLNKY